MTENKLKWTLMRGSTGVNTLHTNWFTRDLTPNHKILGDIIPSRTGTFVSLVKVDNDHYSSGLHRDVIDAMKEVEDQMQELIEKYTATKPATPKEERTNREQESVKNDVVIYDPHRPIIDQIERNWVISQKPYFLQNKRIVCGNYFLSIQASSSHYCSPRQNNDDPKDYNSFELAIMDQDGEFVGRRLVPDMFEYDDVAGGVEPRILDLLAQKIQKLPVGYIHPDYKPAKGFDEEGTEAKPVEDEPKKPTKFYTYRQNNSGGSWLGPAKYVIVEGVDAEDANKRAQEKGLYFDGAGDCSCCGSRWSEAHESDGESEPKIYDEPAKSYTEECFSNETARIFYADGREDHWIIPVVRKNHYED